MSLTLFPAIDLKGGACVRLKRGDMNAATIYREDPAAQARDFEAAGFAWLHVVDLDGAFAGKPANAAAVRAIIGATGMKVQLGGGIRTLATIEAWLAEGVTRVILGSIAAKDPALVREAGQKFPGRIVVGIDAREGKVATEGWAETSDIEAEALAVQLADAGIEAIIHTDIARDGMLGGLNLEATASLAQAVAIPVIASGGVAGIGDIVALKAAHARVPNLAGTIIGRALYDGRIDAAEALRLC
jgi:phosphoribosylformimino-5-aminoimidazole carboxamide ribotide isomerase